MDNRSTRLYRGGHQQALFSKHVHKTHRFCDMSQQFADLNKADLANHKRLPERERSAFMSPLS
jgi:hypothetical protein